jgi:CheY-like chemotaxis protein
VGDLMSVMFTGRGDDVLVAPDGLSGLKLPAAVRPDVVRLDIRMPGPDGVSSWRRPTTTRSWPSRR